MAIKRVHAVVTGRVQGVFFRACTEEEARKYALSGWVRNRSDGSVEAEFQGEESEIGRMLSWLRIGSPLSEVTDVFSSDREVVSAERGFTVKY